jgi:hypothetical protein
MTDLTPRENTKLENFVSTVHNFVARRNEIAHGRVYNPGEHGYYLGPSNLIKSRWATASGEAKFQYVVVADNALYYAEKVCRSNYDGPTNQTQALLAACLIRERNAADDYIAQH